MAFGYDSAGSSLFEPHGIVYGEALAVVPSGCAKRFGDGVPGGSLAGRGLAALVGEDPQRSDWIAEAAGDEAAENGHVRSAHRRIALAASG